MEGQQTLWFLDILLSAQTGSDNIKYILPIPVLSIFQ